MAVGDTFANQFTVGDVIYGASQARGPYMASLPNGLRQMCEDGGAWLICDNYNNRTFNRLVTGQYPTSKAAIEHNLDQNDQDATITDQQRRALEEYYEALASSARRPTKAVKMKLSEVTAKGNQDHADLCFRRACKFGLEFFLMTKKVQVHFALDLPAFYGMGPFQDSTDIVNKAQHAGHVPITTSELRCCYRNRKTWVGSGRLKFYKNLVEVPPPWVTDAATWARYDQARFKKHHPILNTISRCFH